MTNSWFHITTNGIKRDDEDWDLEFSHDYSDDLQEMLDKAQKLSVEQAITFYVVLRESNADTTGHRPSIEPICCFENGIGTTLYKEVDGIDNDREWDGTERLFSDNGLDDGCDDDKVKELLKKHGLHFYLDDEEFSIIAKKITSSRACLLGFCEINKLIETFGYDKYMQDVFEKNVLRCKRFRRDENENVKYLTLSDFGDAEIIHYYHKIIENYLKEMDTDLRDLIKISNTNQRYYNDIAIVRNACAQSTVDMARKLRNGTQAEKELFYDIAEFFSKKLFDEKILDIREAAKNGEYAEQQIEIRKRK